MCATPPPALGAGERPALTHKYVKGTLAVDPQRQSGGRGRLRARFEYQGAIFHTTSDSELIAYAIAQARAPRDQRGGRGVPGCGGAARGVLPDRHVPP